MSETVKMPALGESVTEGTVTRWLKEVGEEVAVDEPLLEVSTDKVDTEVPSPVAGVLEKILVEEDEDAEVGADLAVIGDGSGSAGEDAGDSGAAAEPAAEENLATDETTAPSTDEPVEDSAAEQPTDQDPEPASGGSAPSGSDAGDAGDRSPVEMPALGESVTEGTVTRWLKEVGEEVAVDEPLLEVSTDKVDTEVPSPVAGTLLEIVVGEDEDAEVGSVLAYVGSGDAAAPAAEEPAPEAPQAEEKKPEQPKAAEKPADTPSETPKVEEKPAPAPQNAPQTATEQKAKPATSAPEAKPSAASAVSGSRAGAGYVTPLVRKLAATEGVDLASVQGTGVGGRIRKEDVLAAAEEARKAAAPAPSAPSAPAAAAPAASAPAAAPTVEVSSLRGTEEKMTRIRKVTAKRMVESMQTQAQLTTAVEVDMTKVAALRARAKNDFQAREGAKLTFLPFIALAAVEGLKIHPNINAQVDGDMIKYPASENLGIAADTPRGLVVPVIKNAGDLNLAGLARQIADVGGRAKSNDLKPDDVTGMTFSITNTGSGGALFDTPIVPDPTSAILGCGTIVKRPAVLSGPDGDVIAIRSMMYLFLSYDHRLIDGGDAARYLTYLKKRLEDGAFEGELGL
jgi:pyruvate dehydrogenase E2 component (dihydrolipoamide acetyltransferase)